MTDLEIQQNRQLFLDYCHQYVHREGLDKLLNYLEHTDFFEAPSSTKFHLNVRGGLCKHSLNVFETALSINKCILLPKQKSGESIFSEPLSEESIAVAALFHDVCKCNMYKVTERWRKDEHNKWESYKAYEVSDDFPFGHGEKSCYIVSHYIRLMRDELLAMRWHMGMYDVGEAGTPNRFSFHAATDASPLVVLLQMADMASSHWFEETFQ